MKVANILYLPNLENSSKFLSHFRQFKTGNPTFVLTDGPIRDEDMHKGVIAIPKIGPFNSDIGRTKRKDMYALWAFISSVRFALDIELDYFIYLEEDCRFTSDNWDSAILQDTGKEFILGGTPVCWHPWSRGHRFSAKLIDFAYQYQYHSKYPMAFEGDYNGPFGCCFYPNGALGVYKVSEMAEYFKNALVHSTVEQGLQLRIALFLHAFDMYIGKCFVEKYKDRVFDHFNPAFCSYSGCENHHVTLTERVLMLKNKLKVAIHHLKEKELPL